MIPGRATHTPPDFPSDWCGLWKDPTGKVMYLEQIQGRHLAVTFAAGLEGNYFPLEDGPKGITRRLPGIYETDASGVPVLRVEVGEPIIGAHYNIHFIFGEGDRLRTAEAWDMVSGVIARPKLGLVSTDEFQDNTQLSWAYPLANYWKMDEEEMRFMNFHLNQS